MSSQCVAVKSSCRASVIVGLVALSATLLAWPTVGSAQTALSCGQAANTLPGTAGTTLTVSCPADCGGGAVWGDGMYSDDSAICTAAIHAGVLTTAGGTTTITIAPGQLQYASSTRNGVTTSAWASWERSFTFAQVMPVDCFTNAQNLASSPGTQVRIRCPAGCLAGGTVWGTGTYSDDSAVCVAAIHAGVLTDGGGEVTVHITPGLGAYPASSLNGVTTSTWGAWQRSFTLSQ